MLIIREQDKQAIVQIAKKVLQTKLEIWAFGSRVNGNCHSTSDLDLVLKTTDQTPLPMNELNQFKEALRDSNIPIIVQVLDWNRIPKSFCQNIMKKYEVLTQI